METKALEPLALRRSRVARQLLAPLDYLARVACETGFFRLSLLLIEARAEAQSLGCIKGKIRSRATSCSGSATVSDIGAGCREQALQCEQARGLMPSTDWESTDRKPNS
jgi:hypothetical protein